MNGSLKDIYQQYLVNCLSRQCAYTKKFVDRHRSHFASNRQSAGFNEKLKEITFGLCIESAKGSKLTDLDGNEYIDLTMGFGVHLFGHSPEFIRNTLLERISYGASLGPFYTNAGEVAELVCTLTKNERCAFFNSGTEAVMVALRLARAATNKNKIVIFEGSYHGTLDSVLVLKHHPISQEAISSIPGITQAQVSETFLLPFGDPAAISFIKNHSHEIAAVLAEPVRSRHPEMVNPDFLHQLQHVCAENNITFILDEVITGFRIGNGGAKELFQLKPDMVIYGKIVGGGFPIGIVAGTKHFLDFIDGGKWQFGDDSKPGNQLTFVAGTFCHHPLSMAAAKAVLQYLKQDENKIQRTLTKNTEDFCAAINSFCAERNIPVSLANFGSLFRFLLKGKSKMLYHSLLKEKIYIWEGRNCFFSTAHLPEDYHRLSNTIKKCLMETDAAGYYGYQANVEEKKRAGWYMVSELELGEIIQQDMLRYCFQYVCLNLGYSLGEKCTYHFEGIDFVPSHPENTSPTWPDIILEVHYSITLTHLKIKVMRSLLDGWSVILFIRALGKCIQAIKKYEPLPFPVFTPQSEWVKWLGTPLNLKKSSPSNFKPVRVCEKKIEKAKTNIPLVKNLFEYLLVKFALALGINEIVIGIPLSGQLMARQLNVAGNLTCLVPIRFCFNEEITEDKAIEIAVQQLAEAKKKFRFWYSNQANLSFNAIFNMDNLLHDFHFGDTSILSLRAWDEGSNFPLVCNVLAEKNKLHISLKTIQEANHIEPEAILEKYCSSLMQIALPCKP